MEAADIVTRVKSDTDVPSNWKIFPLQREKLLLAMFGWVCGVVIGLGLLWVVWPIVVPYNFQHGIFATIFTIFLLGVLLFIGLGSIWTLYVDLMRLLKINQHFIVITPDDFLKQEGDKTVHVPLVNVRHVTARGAPPPDNSASSATNVRQIPNAGESAVGFFFGRRATPSGQRMFKKRMRTPTSLAFIDSRTNKEVTVLQDGVYGDPFLIAAFLRQYSSAVQQLA